MPRIGRRGPIVGCPRGLARLVMGSVSTATLQRAEIPLLLTRPPVPAAAMNESAVAQPEPVAPEVTVSLAAGDLELVEEGLRPLRDNTRHDEDRARPLRELLGKLERARAP